MKVFQVGDRVQWSWGEGEAVGVIQEIIKEPITLELRGTMVRCEGSEEDPAFLIRQDDGDELVKRSSEVEHITRTD